MWKRMTELPERVEALEKRLAQLESQPAIAPGLACPSCGAFAFRVVASRKSRGPFGVTGAMEREYRCSECSFTETRDVDG